MSVRHGELAGDDSTQHGRLENAYDGPEGRLGIAAPSEREGELGRPDGRLDLAAASIEVSVRVGEVNSKLVDAALSLDERRERRDNEVVDERCMQGNTMIPMPAAAGDKERQDD